VFGTLVTCAAVCALALIAGTPAALAQSASEAPIELKFTEPTPVLDIYRALARVSSFDLVLDPDLKNRSIVFELPEMPPRQALDALTRAVGHFYYPMDENTYLVAMDTPVHRRHYEPLVIQIFVLDHIAVQDAMTVLRSLLEVKKIATVPLHNALLVRDTEQKVRSISELLRRLDRPDGKLDRAALEPMVVGTGDQLGSGEPIRVAEKP